MQALSNTAHEVSVAVNIELVNAGFLARCSLGAALLHVYTYV